MARLRTVMGALAAGSVGVAVLRHARGASRWHAVDGGILIGDAGGYDTVTRLALRGFFRGVASDVAAITPDHGRVLEVGCGPGHLSIQLARQHALEVTGLDLDPAMIDLARANAATTNAASIPTFEVGDVASMPFPDGTFDVVVSTLSMHHWTDLTAGLAEIGRVLRPSGRALIWDLRAGVHSFHAHRPDPDAATAGSALRIVSTSPWRWPWRLTPTERIELEPASSAPVTDG